ncbi:MAG: hypothetical protein GC206_12425 [Alphaproteobacteria bacterium]|nr:hypothetical protein [Alphaproteobacteria bacterium]
MTKPTTTQPKADQFSIAGRRALHVPTGARIDFPVAQPWTSNGYSLCEIFIGRADSALDNGDFYRVSDIIDEARRLMLSRAQEKAA